MLTAMDSTTSSSYWLPSDADPLLCHLMPPTPTPEPHLQPPPHQLRVLSAGRRIAKRRPRPSRRLPTTYISADPSNFRQLVHEVTGASNLLPPPSPPTLLRPTPSRSATEESGGALLLPTLDTSALLLGSAGPALAEPAANACGSAGSDDRLVNSLAPGLSLEFELEGMGACNNNGNNNGFPTLESWGVM